MSKRDIHRQLWPDTFVTDGSVAVLVAEIRAALGDNVRQPVFMRTLHRFGYAFVAPVVEAVTRADSTPRAVQCWLASGNERAPLEAGDNVVGRDPLANIRVGLDPAADLRIDAAGISRRHALVVVAEETITLHDLSSKNGTFVNEVRVTTPVLLHDGAEVRLGSVSLQFRRVADVCAQYTQEVADEQTSSVEGQRTPEMTLSRGSRLGPYQVERLLGSGGMGEVYRARDTTLNRDVAIKVLLPSVTADPERLSRFSREAQVLASLNHPHIAQI